MIYNLVELLRNQFTPLVIFVNGRVPVGASTPPNRCLVVNETGGTEQPWTLYQQLTFQVIARDMDAVKARVLAISVFAFLTSRFGLILPKATVGGTTYPAVSTAQISAIQVPYYLGPDEDGRPEYTCNYQVVMER